MPPLFSISATSPRNLSSLLAGKIAECLPDGGEVAFFIADSLQLYNHAADGLDIIEASPGKLAAQKAEKEGRITSIETKLRDVGISIVSHIFSMAQLQSAGLYEIRRIIDILYARDEAFRSDIDASALGYAVAGRPRMVMGQEARACLSRMYLCEEIAVNIYLRYALGYRDEYYCGTFPQPLMAFYAGEYRLLPWALVRPPSVETIYFNELTPAGWKRTPAGPSFIEV